MNEKGVSLLELIIYVAIFSVIVLIMANVFFVSMRGRDLANARFEVSQNIRFATEKIRQAVFDASLISVSGSCPLNVLEITNDSATSSIYVSDGILKYSDANGVSDITVDKVIATSTDNNCLFAIISNPLPAKPTLQTKIKIVYNSQGRSDLEIGESQQMTVSLR